jgi:HSP20 family protein
VNYVNFVNFTNLRRMLMSTEMQTQQPTDINRSQSSAETSRSQPSTDQNRSQPKNNTVVHPLVDVFENEGGFLLIADLPGVTKDALEITANSNQLEILAETDSLEYRRSFALGDDVDLEAVEAKLENGELRIQLPKRPEARVRKISVAG